MPRVKIHVRGIDRVQNRLGIRGASDLKDAIELDIANETRKMAVQGAKDSPVDTGALRASILSSPRRAGTMTYYWGSRLPYALRQEYEHRQKRGWLRKAWRQGNVRLKKTLKITVKTKLGG